MMFIASIRKGSVLDRAWRNHARRSAVVGGVTFRLTPGGYVSDVLEAGALTALATFPVVIEAAGIEPAAMRAVKTKLRATKTKLRATKTKLRATVAPLALAEVTAPPVSDTTVSETSAVPDVLSDSSVDYEQVPAGEAPTPDVLKPAMSDPFTLDDALSRTLAVKAPDTRKNKGLPRSRR